ncbi:unnamed protein product [Haemonchus placei]|uniref:Uncharacterized protein n=1 Tax=Haemonchus placei TaxID=6290 RepID=A0A3P7UYS1_HAEPC|nr:unnamed protein product [Haemonchus placei]
MESFRKSATDAIVIVALLCSTDTLFSFPIEVLRNGGYFFLIIYFFIAFLISFPILHLELFVSQYLQSGILKSFLLYGSGYTGFGISILLLTLANQNLAIHKGYYYLNHAIKLYDGVEKIVDCMGSSYVQRNNCESLYNNKICTDIDGHGNVFVEGACKNVTGKADRIERAANVQSSMMAYIEHALRRICGASTGRLYELAETLERRRIDFCAVQETRWSCCKSRDIGLGFKAVLCGGPKTTDGVGIIQGGEKLRVHEFGSDPIVVVTECQKYHLFSAYAPQTGCSEQTKDTFWNLLDEKTAEIPFQ